MFKHLQEKDLTYLEHASALSMALLVNNGQFCSCIS